MPAVDRKEEILTTCLNQFVEKGLYRTTSRDLSGALKLQNSGLYYYFKSKDEAVIACAEEASFLLEDGLIIPALADTDNADRLIANLYKRSTNLAPMMRFLSQVCSANEYRDAMKPALFRLEQRFRDYALRFARKLNCDVEVIEPYFSMCVSMMSNYMLFGECAYISPQIRIVTEKLNELISVAKESNDRGC